MIKLNEMATFSKLISCSGVIDQIVIGHNPITKKGMAFGNESQKTLAVQVDGFDWDADTDEIAVGLNSLLPMLQLFEYDSELEVSTQNKLILRNDEGYYSQNLADINLLRGKHLDTSVRINGLNASALKESEAYASMTLTAATIQSITDAIKKMKCEKITFSNDKDFIITFQNLTASYSKVLEDVRTFNFEPFSFDANMFKKILDTVRLVSNEIELRLIKNQMYISATFEIDGKEYELSVTQLKSVQPQLKSTSYVTENFNW